jgi:serine/threonine protein kinase/WD40 repeat protein
MVGQTVGHYRIVRKIGQGGMGCVYLAEDLQLDRHVALKTLAEPPANPDHIARFEREAKAAAALNHPNILAIHDYGVHESMPYVIMELLEGRNLRQVLRDGPLAVPRALDYAIELVHGLSAAHDKGICHRDLKPENIFITHDARVKILDFGLATDRAAAALPTPPADQVTRAALTVPGIVLGTVGYMAPEQIRGERLDGRADIFAVGAVIFEMLTGQRAFDEPTAVETLHCILKGDPSLHLLVNATVPASLAAIVQQCLQKRPERRFQSARDLLAALKGARSAGEISPDTAAHRPRNPAAETNAATKLERVTNTSAVTLSPALSSDGRLVVYVSDSGQDETAPQVWVQQVGGTAMRLTTGLRECAEPAFSADQTEVLFTARGSATLSVYRVPTLGGEPRLVKRNARGARMSPDGRWMSYLSLESRRGLRLVASDGEDDRLVAPGLMDVSCAVWSPDSRYLLVRAHPDTAFEREYWIVPVDGRSPVNTGIVERFKAQAAVLDLAPAWLGTSFVFAAGTRDGVMLFRQRFAPESFEMVDQPEPITRGTEWAAWPSAAGNRLAFVSAHPDHNLWSIRLDPSTGVAARPPQRITRGPGLMGQMSPAANGARLAYFSTRTRKPELVLRDLTHATESVLSAEPAHAVKSYPALSPSGSQLAHGMLVPGPRALRPIVVVDLAAGTSRQLSDDSGGRPRQWIDERHLLIETFGSRLNSLVLVDTVTGSQREFLSSPQRSVSNPRISPDGTRIAFDATPPGGAPAVLVAPLTGEMPIPENAWTVVDESASHPFWSADGRLLYYLPLMPNTDLRSGARARRIGGASGRPEGDAFDAIAFKEMFVPTVVPGTAPFVASDDVICVLADLRGDIWVMSV